jgi:hypothetical protein
MPRRLHLSSIGPAGLIVEASLRVDAQAHLTQIEREVGERIHFFALICQSRFVALI